MNSFLIFKQLYQLMPYLNEIENKTVIKNDKFQILEIEVLDSSADNLFLSLCNSFKHSSGDLIPDPHVTIHINKIDKVANVLSFENMYKFESVCPESNAMNDFQNKANKQLQLNLNEYLTSWLLNMINERHKNVG